MRMFYVGETPWHGLGTKLDNPATAEEAIKASGLDYKVVLEDIQTKSGVPIKDRKATVRIDTNAPLGIVSSKYQVIQNSEAFEFFDSVVGMKEAIYHTAGALGEGERIWILAKLPKIMLIANQDTVEKYLCLTTSHNGLTTLGMYFTPIRVVCQNTLSMSFHNKTNYISIKHYGNLKSKIQEAQRVLGLAIQFYDDFEIIANQFASKQVSVQEVEGYYNRLLNIENKLNDEVSTHTTNRKNQLLALFENGRGNDLPAIRHTAWTAYNAVVEYVDFYRTARGGNRLQNIWFGSGAEFKTRAFEEIKAVVGIK